MNKFLLWSARSFAKFLSSSAVITNLVSPAGLKHDRHLIFSSDPTFFEL